jgi:internalin A
MDRNRRVFKTFYCLAAVAVVLSRFASASRAQDGELDVHGLIASLGHPEFHVRQEATASLQSLGDEVIPLLCKAAESADSEIRSRALGILKEKALATSSEARDSARQALTELSTGPNARVRTLAEMALIQVRETTAGIAFTELTQLGATLMPVYGAPPLTFNVQIGQGWKGTNDRLALLGDLGDVPWVSFESSTIDDGALHYVAKLAQANGGPTRLFLGNSKVRGADLSVLAPLVRLEYLSLKQLSVTDAHIAKLPELPALQYLGLDGTRITDDGLALLRRYKQLQVLWLDGTPITDAGIVNLAGLDGLRTLYLPGTHVHGPGLAELGNLPNLVSLSLKGNKLSPDCLKHLSQLEQLESLGLDSTDVVDSQLADLAGLNRLRVLWLVGTQVSDAGLAHLKSLNGLQILHLSDTQVTKDGAAALQHALPKCQITMNSLPREEPAAPQNAPPRRPGSAPAKAGN